MNKMCRRAPQHAEAQGEDTCLDSEHGVQTINWVEAEGEA